MLRLAIETGSTSLTNCVGIAEFEPYVTSPLDILSGDLFMACSDGLFTEVPKHKILEALEARSGSLENLGDFLFPTAIENGGWDNISHILARSEDHIQTK